MPSAESMEAATEITDAVSVTSLNAPYVWEVSLLEDNIYLVEVSFDVDLITPIGDEETIGSGLVINQDDLN